MSILSGRAILLVLITRLDQVKIGNFLLRHSVAGSLSSAAYAADSRAKRLDGKMERLDEVTTLQQSKAGGEGSSKCQLAWFADLGRSTLHDKVC